MRLQFGKTTLRRLSELPADMRPEPLKRLLESPEGREWLISNGIPDPDLVVQYWVHPIATSPPGEVWAQVRIEYIQVRDGEVFESELHFGGKIPPAILEILTSFKTGPETP